MGALTIAFDTIIVGALALPWVLLVVHLFFFEGEKSVLEWLKEQNWGGNQGQAAVAGIILFAMAYTLGSAVSRMAQDFFNDDDLHVPRLLRMAMTEDRIIASVYCDLDRGRLLRGATENATLAERINAFECLKSNHRGNDGNCPADAGANQQAANQQPESQQPANCPAKSSTAQVSASPAAPQPEPLCVRILSARGHYMDDERHDDETRLIHTARDIFSVQENGLLLKGQDATLRLHQLHDQIMVLRGATFDGLLAFSFCLFAWGVAVRGEKPRSLLRFALALVPGVFLFLAAEAFYHHYQERAIGDPPYMEYSLFIIGAAGAWLLWRPRRLSSGTENQGRMRSWTCGALSLIFAVLVVAGILGWWSTEVLYSEQVVYSYASQATAQK